MKRFWLPLFLTVLSSQAFGSAARVLDGATITNGAALITLPTTTADLSALGTSSGANSGDITLGAFGSTPNTVGLSLTGQALNLQPADATHPGGLSTADWNTFNNKQAGPLTGDVTTSGAAATLANTAVSPGSYTNANITVDSKGRLTSASNGTGTAPTITGSRGSPTAVTAGGGVSFTGTNYTNYAYIQGSGGAVTVTANPQVAAATNDGQHLTIIGRSATNTVTLADGTGLSLNGSWVGGLDSVLVLTWDGSVWREDSRR